MYWKYTSLTNSQNSHYVLSNKKICLKKESFFMTWDDFQSNGISVGICKRISIGKSTENHPLFSLPYSCASISANTMSFFMLVFLLRVSIKSLRYIWGWFDRQLSRSCFWHMAEKLQPATTGLSRKIKAKWFLLQFLNESFDLNQMIHWYSQLNYLTFQKKFTILALFVSM